MILGKKVVVVMPAYNAERTVEKTWREVIAQEIVDLVIVVDDASRDATVERARMLDKVIVHTHPSNRGYGANQKTCYRIALENAADIVIMRTLPPSCLARAAIPSTSLTETYASQCGGTLGICRVIMKYR